MLIPLGLYQGFILAARLKFFSQKKAEPRLATKLKQERNQEQNKKKNTKLRDKLLTAKVREHFSSSRILFFSNHYSLV